MTVRKPTSGNRTARRGSRYVQNPHLDRDTAQTIKILVTAAGKPYTRENVAVWIAEQARREWHEYDERIQAAADEAYEGGAL